MVPWTHSSQQLKRHLNQFSRFVPYIPVTNTQTDTQTTLRVTSVAIGRIYAAHATRPKTVNWKLRISHSNVTVSGQVQVNYDIWILEGEAWLLYRNSKYASEVDDSDLYGNNNNNNLRLLGSTSNRAINTVRHPPRRAGNNSHHAGQHYNPTEGLTGDMRRFVTPRNAFRRHEIIGFCEKKRRTSPPDPLR